MGSPCRRVVRCDREEEGEGNGDGLGVGVVGMENLGVMVMVSDGVWGLR